MKKNYKALVKHMLFENPGKYFTNDLTGKVANEYRKLLIRTDSMIQDKHWRQIYDALVAGDPKLRTLRAIRNNIATSYAAYAKTFRKGGERSG